MFKKGEKPTSALLLSINPKAPIEVVRHLLDAGADPISGTIYDRNNNAIMRACEVGRADILRSILWAVTGQSGLKKVCSAALFCACKRQLTDAVVALLNAGANPNELGKGNTILLEAVIAGNVEIVRLLLRANANVNQRGNDDLSPLHIACTCSLAIVRLLLEYGADVNAKARRGLTPLIVASFHGRVEIVRALLVKGANVNDALFVIEQDTALSMAYDKGFRDIIQLLLDAGTTPSKGMLDKSVAAGNDGGSTSSNINSGIPRRSDRLRWLFTGPLCIKNRVISELEPEETNSTKLTDALMLAINETSPVEAVQALLDAGAAPIGAVHENKKTCIMRACEIGRVDILKVLLLAAKGKVGLDASCMSAFTYACNEELTDIVAVLLQAGAKPNVLSTDVLYTSHGWKNKNTVLIDAVIAGNAEIVTLLIKYKGNVNQKGNDGLTPLHLACTYNLTIVKLLLDHGADVNTKADARKGITPLMVATSHGCVDVTRLLLERGANVNAKIKVHDTALTMACENGFLDIIQLLLDAGATLGKQLHRVLKLSGHKVVKVLASNNALPDTNQTLHSFISKRCASANDLQIIYQLLKFGADPNELDEEDTPALNKLLSRNAYWMCEEQSLILMHMLLDAGADVNAQNSVGATPLIMACSRSDYIAHAMALLNRGADPSITRYSGSKATSDVPAIKAILRGQPVDLESPYFAIMARQDYDQLNVPAHFHTCNDDATAVREGGVTMLMQALQYERYDAVRALLSHDAVRAQVNLARCDGLTALMLACQGGADADIVRALIDAGADVLARDSNYHWYPITFAASEANLEACQILIDAMGGRIATDEGQQALNQALDVALEKVSDMRVIALLAKHCKTQYFVHADDWVRTLPGRVLLDAVRTLIDAGVKVGPHILYRQAFPSPLRNELSKMLQRCADW